ncbi:hypothetical protein VaNZ11_001891 [Volvox africanus]|uniref:CBS domain-containing protein n=1 Tax=Volvox africanus TaxID=51714 RepID=A0ABQ5RRJ4_9CHLO|nr:hypothetical protein VaNZ11_001891 [Volvox africanus]
MTATTTLTHSASSVPSSLRTSGHATPNHGSRSNTPVRTKKVVQAQLEGFSTPVVPDSEAWNEGRNVRRSSSAHALESATAHHNVISRRRRRLSVTTFGDFDEPSSVDADPTCLDDVLARRHQRNANHQGSMSLDLSASLPVLSLQMRLGEYAVLGPDASVALAYNQVADPAIQCVAIASPGATYILSRQDVERITRYCHDPKTDTLGTFLSGTIPAPALYSTASLASAAGMLLEKSDVQFLAVVEEASASGGTGTFLGLLSRADLVQALLGDRSCVYDPQPAAAPTTSAAATSGDTAAAIAVAAVAVPPSGATAVAVGKAIATTASSSSVVPVSRGPSRGSMAPAAATVVEGTGEDTVGANGHNRHVSNQNNYMYLPSHIGPPVATQLPHRAGAPARQATAAALAATVATTVAAAPPTGAFPLLGVPLEQQPILDLSQPSSHQLLSHTILADGANNVVPLLPPLASPQLQLLPLPLHLLESEAAAPGDGAAELNAGSHSHPTGGVDHSPPAAAEGLKSFADPIKSGWDVLDNVDDAMDVLGLLGKTVNAEVVGRKLLGDVMGVAANIAGGSSGTGWVFKYLYDGDCSICRTFQATLEKLDNGVGRVMFVDISSQGFNPVEHGGINYKAAMETIHILSANGQVFKGVTAVIKLLAAVDPEIAANMGVVTAALPLLSLAYMLLSKNRHHLSKVWAQLLHLTKADKALFGRDIFEVMPGLGSGASEREGREKGVGVGVGFRSGPAGLSGSLLGPVSRLVGRVGGTGKGETAGEESAPRRASLRSHDLLKTQSST